MSAESRPKNHEVESENQRTPAHEGEPPRPATEPPGSESSTRTPKTETDAGSGRS